MMSSQNGYCIRKMNARRSNCCVPGGLKTEDDFSTFGIERVVVSVAVQTCVPGEHRNFLVQYIQLYSVWKISVGYEVSC